MSDSSAATQVAIIARLRGDATLQALMTGATSPEWNIFDQGGADDISTVFPRIMVHPITTATGTVISMGDDAADVFTQVSTFTSFEGFEQARAIDDRIYDLLHMPAGAAALTLSGFANTWTKSTGKHELEETTDRLVQHIARQFQHWNHV